MKAGGSPPSPGEYTDVSTRVLWSMLNTSVLLLTLVYKVPQVYAVVSSRSSIGISMPSLLLEFASYSIEMTYQIAMAYPFASFLEICFMWAQDVVLLYVVLEDRDLLNRNLAGPLLVYVIIFTSIIRLWLPLYIMYGLILCTTPVLIVSKGTQFWHVVSTGDPGSLSALTWGILTYLATARIPTHIFITGDMAMLLNTSSAAVLDLAVTASVIYYNHVNRRWIYFFEHS